MSEELKLVDIDKLVPYARNARTHSEEQIKQIQASIREFGFVNPVLIDGKFNIIAGHGRILAAKAEGLKEVPCVLVEHLTEAQKRNGVKDCLCVDCGTEFTVRKDTHPIVCKRCVQVRGGKALKGTTRAERKLCVNCGKPILASAKGVYCSLACKYEAAHIKRICKNCNEEFSIYQSALKTNSAGNFCSRRCYEKWLCHTERITGRGSQWNKSRKEALKLLPFCAVCGTTKNLQVHHIAPFRLNHDNDQTNIIPLCTKHHKLVESMTHEIEHTGSAPEDMTLIMGNILRERAFETACVIKNLLAVSAYAK